MAETGACIQVNATELKINLRGSLCNKCAWKDMCTRHMSVNYLSIKSVADKMNINVEIAECGYFLNNQGRQNN